VSIEPGTLYVVATPIGNLGDLSPRAREVLEAVAVIAAEDTRHSAPLLRGFAIDTPLRACHEHNERKVSAELIGRLQEGETVALISDAGTPLLSDPGYHLVSAAHTAGCPVVPVPGPSALVAALSVAGLPSDRFAFEGFLPARGAARRSRLGALAAEPRTLIFYEAPHRLAASLADLAELFGAERPATLARELTKRFETVRRATLGRLAQWVAEDSNQQRGEAVLVVQGAPETGETELTEHQRHAADVLARQLPVSQAAALAAEITGGKKNRFYRYLVQQK